MTRVLLAIVASILCAACANQPQPSDVFGSDGLPADWTVVGLKDSRYLALDATTRRTLIALKELIAKEMTSTAYTFYGRLSDETLKRIAEVQDECNTSYMVCFAMIARNPTPELSGVAETENDRTRGQAMVLDVNMRSIQDEWEGAWLMDRPASSAFPLVNTSGQP
ncbi:MAG: hypothetical protein EXS00_08705 [Phycisphaerales bacterium]|nr:hypothetical protein [Phycisphaerales bacterium]